MQGQLRRLLLLVLVLAAVVVGVSALLQRPYPTALIVLPGAESVEYHRYKGTDQVSYALRQRYPAKQALSQISSWLAKQGWKPLKEDYLNPGLPSSHVRGWQEFADASGKEEEWVRSWVTDWTNARGDVVRYMLMYRWPLNGQQQLDRLQVFAVYNNAKEARALRRAAIEHMKQGRGRDAGKQ